MLMRLDGVAVPFMINGVRDVAVGIRGLVTRGIRILRAILNWLLRIAQRHIRVKWLLVLRKESCRCRSESLQVSDHV